MCNFHALLGLGASIDDIDGCLGDGSWEQCKGISSSKSSAGSRWIF
jgi:hypothetical protein